MYYTISTFSPSFPPFLFSSCSFTTYLGPGSYSIVLSLTHTHSHSSIFTSPLNSAFEIIKARIFQRAVPAKLVFCFDSAIDRTSSHVLSITLFVLLDIPTFQWNLYRLTNALDSFFSFSHFLKPVKGSLSLTRYSNIIFLLFNGRNIYRVHGCDAIDSWISRHDKNTEEFLRFARTTSVP